MRSLVEDMGWSEKAYLIQEIDTLGGTSPRKTPRSRNIHILDLRKSAEARIINLVLRFAGRYK